MLNDSIVFYRSGFITKRWRWRYQAAGNHEKMANGSEGYETINDCIAGAFRVCAIKAPPPTIKIDTAVERCDGRTIVLRFRL